MRKIVVLLFVSIDGVIQSPGGPDEDVSGGFKYGGWTVPYSDDYIGEVMFKQMDMPFDLLLGRKTYQIFASYWPHQDESTSLAAAHMNKAKKYVVSNNNVNLEWANSVLINKDVVSEIRKLKEQDGPLFQVYGSSNLVQTLLKNDLVDELWLKIYPITLGSGKRLFGEGTIPAGFKVIQSHTSPSGVVVVSYRKSGKVKTGSFE
ncbi:MAG: dihydrofolate reductase family protein [Candidatus Saccharibacteria bacterium]|nr:dihydrofolate reductase family protein [Candidatus Saccharibacteria bacterium]